MYFSPKPKHFFGNPTLYGCIFNIAKQVGGQIKALEAGCKWILENSRFTGKFTEQRWIQQLERWQKYSNNCIAVVIPDRPFDALETIREFWHYYRIPKIYGYPIALVTQNGMTINDIPWSEIDVLFIGGDDRHKRGLEAQQLALAAKNQGKWVHVGRCNSGTAMLTHWTWADSWDGTTLAKHPVQQLESITNGVISIRNGAGHQLILLED